VVVKQFTFAISSPDELLVYLEMANSDTSSLHNACNSRIWNPFMYQKPRASYINDKKVALIEDILAHTDRKHFISSVTEFVLWFCPLLLPRELRLCCTILCCTVSYQTNTIKKVRMWPTKVPASRALQQSIRKCMNTLKRSVSEIVGQRLDSSGRSTIEKQQSLEWWAMLARQA